METEKIKWNKPLISVDFLYLHILNGDIPPTVIIADGKEVTTNSEALRILQECKDRGIVYL